jgi:hypothetical protein
MHALATFAAFSLFVEAVIALGYGRTWEATFRGVAGFAMYIAAFVLERVKLTLGGYQS